MAAFSKLAFVRAYLSTTVLFRRQYYAPLSQTCTAGACACSCKSRRAPRPRKPDGKLNRHGLGARRVALLAPRGCSVSTGIRLVMWVRSPKFLVKLKSKFRILGDENSIPSGGGVPEFGVPAKYHSEARTLCGVSVRRGSLTSMSEDGSISIPLSTPNSLSEHPRDEQYIRSVLEHDEQLIRGVLEYD